MLYINSGVTMQIMKRESQREREREREKERKRADTTKGGGGR
jgi:hypothetical protein